MEATTPLETLKALVAVVGNEFTKLDMRASQAACARALGMSRAKLNDALAGRRSVSWGTVVAGVRAWHVGKPAEAVAIVLQFTTHDP